MMVDAETGVSVRPDPRASATETRLWILQAGFGLLAHAMGRFVLHGSAVAQGARAIAFLGDVGAGKSSAAAAFCRQGFSPVTDDVVAVDNGGDRPVILRGLRRLKLASDSMAAFGIDTVGSPIVDTAAGKRAVSFSGRPLAVDPGLGAIVALEKGPVRKLVRLHPLDAARSLMNYGYLAGGLRKAELSQSLRTAATLAELVPVYRLTRGPGWSDVWESVSSEPAIIGAQVA
jgi:hypothetical protein